MDPFLEIVAILLLDASLQDCVSLSHDIFWGMMLSLMHYWRAKYTRELFLRVMYITLSIVLSLTRVYLAVIVYYSPGLHFDGLVLFFVICRTWYLIVVIRLQCRFSCWTWCFYVLLGRKQNFVSCNNIVTSFVSKIFFPVFVAFCIE